MIDEIAALITEDPDEVGGSPDWEDRYKCLSADLDLMERNHALAMKEAKEQMMMDLMDAIDGPLSSLERDIFTAAEAHPDDESVKNVEISYDGLRRRLKSFTRAK